MRLNANSRRKAISEHFSCSLAKLLEPRRNYPRALWTHLTAFRWNDPVLAESVILPLRVQNREPTASPGQWLIDDVARERAEFELRQVSPKPLSATDAAGDAADVEAGVGLPPLDDTRTGGDKRRSEDVTSSIGAPTVDDGVFGAWSSHRALKRSDGAPPRPGTSRKRVDAAAKHPLVWHWKASTGIPASIAKLTEVLVRSSLQGRQSAS